MSAQGEKKSDRLAGRTALVTGASRGIGRAVAETLASEGAELILTARTESQLLQTAGKISKYGIDPHVVITDLADEHSIGGLIEYVNSHFSQLDILVNNAGVTHSGLINETTTASWDQCMAVNARAPFILCRQLLAPLKKSESGYIINVASVVGVKGYAGQTAYTASKHALRGMSMALAEELRDSNIRVHVICPGGVETEMVTQVRPDIPTDELIQPQEIAELILYLVTHQGNAVVDELHIRRKSSNPWF
jgi:NAD(P)-dependent dehydrogenase (short-subunit alcohol dehydrogenase family)